MLYSNADDTGYSGCRGSWGSPKGHTAHCLHSTYLAWVRDLVRPSSCNAFAFLSAQCISSIGQIIKSVCVSVSHRVSQWVSESVTQNELNALQIAIFHRSSPNLPPRQSPRRCGYLLFLVEIWNISIRQTGSGINPLHCSDGKYL